MHSRVVCVASITLLVACGKLKDAQAPQDEQIGGETAPASNETTTTDPSTSMTSFRVLATGDLPECNKKQAGALGYVVDESKFFACTSAGWAEVSIQGPKGDPGPQGERGPIGAQGEQGPVGAKGETGATGPKGDQGDQGIQGIQGIPGTAGTNGVNGTNGSNGTNGVDGAPGPSQQVFVYSASNVRLGVLVSDVGGRILIMLSDGSLGYFYTHTGLYSGTPSYYNTSSIGENYCFFTSNDCTGTCYAGIYGGPDSKPMKNTLYFTGNAWFRATGNESNGGSLAVNSRLGGGSSICNAFSDTLTTSYAITTTYSFPTGITYPFSAPLYLGL